ncbi:MULTISPECIES: ABC transporter ATP-binding protein [unclassified Sporosarcina]|uniref:ABC transporter ATP-binding protein n=1 Tax=unclassified Sporosarcina TaxID=2647733 RepID=UPI000C1646DE|nr:MULTISPECIES: ABC transporter ATP-binding protein [unclassified Sporosarcina]PIC98433.1 spermidine/putrescine ABC transporter ATP-binding protein [Sporosarcina sp. P29]PID04936.1 spermidine/putrescine ABC transporter ATP-binding protein [Sporosarcina sp. P30]PID08195.1 spermidine/putrescine ABC transporter ATP-binding protein [Sporosarcina sp. P31]PID11275.1 spermidine/putrescine ABC transporter ATP-binding protein [Sporosarcina sp. P32b]
MIELQEVSKKYRSKRALNRVSLALPRGKIIGLVGENGSGKTTLLKVLAGILKPTTGLAILDNNKITRRVASSVAYMPDTDLFYPYFTVKQLFEFYDSQFEDFDMKKAQEIAEYLVISLEVKISTLSKGNRGRVKIAATLGRNAAYYLLDEPFSGLDPMVREDIARGLIRFTDTEWQTILLSTHEIKEVEPLLDELIVLKEGQVLAHKEIDEIRDVYGIDATSWMISLFRQ